MKYGNIIRAGLMALPVFLLVIGYGYPAGAQEEKGDTEAGQQEDMDDIMQVVVADPTRQMYPIAIPDIMAASDQPEAQELNQTVTEVIRNNLQMSGFFQILRQDAIFFDPSKEGLAITSINFQNWFNVGAQALVKGQVQRSDDGVMLDLRLYQVDKGQRIKLNWESRQVPLEAVRREIHAFCNEVVRHFTGEPGIFGTRITLVGRTSGGNKAVYTVDHDGENLTLVSSTNTLNILPAWAPTGDAVLYTTYARNNPDLVLQRLGSRETLTLSAQPGLNVGGAFSPDGSKVAVTLSKDGNSEIYVINPSDVKETKRLTNHPAIDSSPTWSPDGQRIAFVSARAGNPHIYIMNADGSEPRRLTFRGTYNTTPDWSPRGDKIAFTARDERSRFDIFTVDVATGDIERLTQDQGNNEEPSFSPDGRYITFTSTREGGRKLFIMTADGGHQTRVIERAGFSTPAWGPRVKLN